MTKRCIFDEAITGIRRPLLIDLVTECAEGLGYATHVVSTTSEETPMPLHFRLRNPNADYIARHDANLRTHIVIFAIDKDGAGTMVELGTVLATPIPPNMRLQVWCETDWQGIGFNPGFSPCEVGAEIVRFILRMVEGNERANAWRPPWEKRDEPAKSESDHWAHPTPEKRAEIVEHYRRERAAGVVSNKNAWVGSNYQISGKTLKRYEDEYDKRPDT